MSLSSELTFEMWRSAEKRCYYLMSSAGAGIGYTLATLDQGNNAADLRLILGALFCWSLSFLFGVRLLGRIQALMYFSKNLVGGDKELTYLRQLAPQETQDMIDTNANKLGAKASFARTLQLLLLLGGAVLLIVARLDISSLLVGAS